MTEHKLASEWVELFRFYEVAREGVGVEDVLAGMCLAVEENPGVRASLDEMEVGKLFLGAVEEINQYNNEK